MVDSYLYKFMWRGCFFGGGFYKRYAISMTSHEEMTQNIVNARTEICIYLKVIEDELGVLQKIWKEGKLLAKQ